MDGKLFPPELRPIAKLLDKPDPPLVIVVGTGVTIGATGQPHASWYGLIENGIKHLVETKFKEEIGSAYLEKLQQAFAPFNLEAALDAAQDIEHNLKYPDERAFAVWLESVFKDLKAQDDKQATLEVLRDLEQAGALLLTTNYDNLLEDITGLPAVTWEEHDDFLHVTRRKKRGILHVHGHWQHPTSVVLGRTSYDRIVADTQIQELLKALWLHKHWLYVGCGNGLDDPNLGALLKWSKDWGAGPEDYFLAQESTAAAIDSRADKPSNLSCIGYPSHDDLPDWLRFITPAARCWPFVPVDDAQLFRTPGSDIPFPTRQEYLDGEVPALAADAEVEQRLHDHGWACVMDVASVGKTTLALRLATSHEQRQHPVYYLDLKKEILDGEDDSPVDALRRLARPGVLLILDNIHHQPELARQLWQQWKYNQADSRLLLVATRVQQLLVTAPEQDLMFFEKHPANPAILLQITPDDLGHLAKHIYRRISGSSMPEPPDTVLAEWYRTYRAALNAFNFAVMAQLPDFQKGKWDIPASAASAWVHQNWLKKLDVAELENVICLAAFGAQELEILVQNEALPHPGKTEKLFGLGLVAKTQAGKFRQYHQLSLREPGWGYLILAAVNASGNSKNVRFDAATRHPVLAGHLIARLKREKLFDELDQLWVALNKEKIGFAARLPDVPLQFAEFLLRCSKTANQDNLALLFWHTIEIHLNKFADRAREASLQGIASFLNVAKKHKRVTEPLWGAIIGVAGESDRQTKLDNFAKLARESSLQEIASFLDAAKNHELDTEPLWGAIIGVAGESDRQTKLDNFAKLARESSLQEIASFLDAAKNHELDTGPLWGAIIGVAGESDRQAKLDNFTEHVWETPLHLVASFLDVADIHIHKHKTEPLWIAIESQPDKLAKRAQEARLGEVASFIEVAEKHGRITTPLWVSLESQPDELAKRAWETPLGEVASFLEVAKKQERDTAPLWDALIGKAGEPDRQAKLDKFAKRAWETPLGEVASFLEVAKKQERDTAPLWDALIGKAGEPDRQAKLDKFAKRAWETPLNSIGSFLDVAQKHGCDTKPLWQTVEDEPDRLSRKGVKAALNDLVGFIHYTPASLSLVKIVLNDIRPGRWDLLPPSVGMAGATWLAENCRKANRDDLASDLVILLLRRANPLDFPAQSGGFTQVCWLLANIPSSSMGLVEAFLKTVCTESWLSNSYKYTSCGQLAYGLRQLALHQSAERIRQFNHKELGWRLNKEMGRFSRSEASDDRPQIIQFFGCVWLCGVTVSPRFLANIDPIVLSQLLPHRPEAERVEEYQWQFWLGLRAFVSITQNRLPISKELVEETLRLWRVNLAGTSAAPTSTEHLINQSMVAWLERCLHAKPVALLPSTRFGRWWVPTIQ